MVWLSGCVWSVCELLCDDGRGYGMDGMGGVGLVVWCVRMADNRLDAPGHRQ